MRPFLLLTVLLLVVPMTLLNPWGRAAFLGYYAGIFAMWLAVASGAVRYLSELTQSGPKRANTNP